MYRPSSIGPSLDEDGFRYDPVKDEPTAVGMVCPLQYLHSGGGKWLKLHITTATHRLWRKGRGNPGGARQDLERLISGKPERCAIAVQGKSSSPKL